MRNTIAMAVIALVGAGVLAQGQEFKTFVCPGQLQTVAIGINARGDIVGWTGPGFWAEMHGMQYRNGECTTFDPPNSTGTVAVKISAKGDIVGWYWDAATGGNSRGFLLREGQFTVFDFPGSPWTVPMGINAAGDIAGYYYDGNWVVHGFLLREGAYETLDYPGAAVTYVIGITDAGKVFGGYDDGNGGRHPFVRDQRGTFTSYSAPPPSMCENGIEVWDMNLKGEMVGKCYSTNGYMSGFLMKDGNYTKIVYPGGPEMGVGGINAEGQFVGSVWWDANWNTSDALIGRTKDIQ